ncbi:MAG TPA: YeeE/YedE thiosulfate transporter family protein [Alphaproteobacteria bacterium]|nr:YeeE/YedE family protein [Alphaproteobacteria bacterium]HOO51747.1 YeeE/YedE thiosulfate transporter family protein [Alphaproteobacteria bacterium]
MTYALPILLGLLFGFALNRVGATNPQNIINMLRLRDTFLMKAIMLGIGIAAVLLFGGLMAGLVDPSHISIKKAYWGVMLGGALLGTGFALAGYCPGTGLAAAATGRKDAVIFVIGGLLGAFAYTLIYGAIKDTSLFDKVLGGAVTLADTGNEKSTALMDGQWLGLVVGAAFIAIATLIPRKIL